MTTSLVRILHRLLNHMIALLRSFLAWISSWWTRASQKPLLLDSGRRVYVGKQLSEGGFSLVFEAYDASESPSSSLHSAMSTSHHPRYVLKRIHGDADMLEACRREAGIHRSIPNHPNVMPLLGMAVTKTHAYLLFPYCSGGSLREEVERRVAAASLAATTLRLGPQPHSSSSSISPSSTLNPPPPWKELEVLQMFQGILQGARALHDRHYSHRDLKLDNILLMDNSSSSSGRNSSNRTPVLMDFGSVGPLQEQLTTRKQVLQAVEHASVHTTISYRPPELFEGGVRVGDTLDYTKADVWGLGCTLFAMAYGQGASPCECEFVTNSHTSSWQRTGSGENNNNGVIRMVDCTHLKVLAELPSPPPPWYSNDFWQLLVDMLHQDPQARPTLATVMERVQALISAALQAGGGTTNAATTSPTSSFSLRRSHSHDSDDGMDSISLLNANRLI